MYNLVRLALVFILTLSISIVLAAETELGGYYKNIIINSKTLALFPPAKSYLLDLNRLRLKLNGDVSNNVTFNIQYDNEIILGNYLETTQFATAKNLQTDSYLDLDNRYIDTNSIYASQNIYRAYLTLALTNVDIRIGRQRIAWGTAMLWNPMDILNPFDPIQLEREERQGIDAALVDWNYNALSRLSLVYARQRQNASTAIRWRTNQKGFDLSFMAGDFRKDTVIGFDFSGQYNKIGLKGEITRTDPADKKSFIRAVLGVDYTFSNTISVNIEAYYNGQGNTNSANYNLSQLFTGKIQSLARHYLGAYLGYDITPLLRWDNFFINNLDDNSFFVAPGLTYSLTDNIELSGGIQAFKGDSGSEYGMLKNIYYLQFQWYF